MSLSALHDYHKRRAQRGRSAVDVLCVGTSTVWGTGASTPEAGFTPRLADAISDGAGGCHYLPTHPGWTRGGTWAVVGQDFGQASISLASGAYMQRTVTCTGVALLFRQGTNVAAAFTVSIDGGPDQTVTVQQGVGTAYDGVWVSGPLTRGAHSIRITGPASGIAEIGGLYAFDGDETAGVRVWCGATPGVTSAVWAPGAAAAASHWRRAGSLNPALLVLMLSSNDYASQVDPDVFQQNVRDAIAYFRLACRPCPVLLVHTYLRPGLGSPAHSWAAYGQKLRELADELSDVDFLDVGPHWPVDRVADEDGLFHADDVHPSEAGHALLGELVAAHLAVLPAAPPSAAAAPAGTDPAALPGLLSAWRAADLPQTDGAAVASWTPYAGSETAPLTQATPAKQPIVRLDQVGGRAAVEIRQPTAPYSTAGQYLSTAAWSAAVAGPVTVMVAARLDRTYGNAWSGISPSRLSMLILGQDMTMGMMAGTSTNGGYVTTGRGRWVVYAAVYNGPNSRFFQTGYPVQALNIPSHAADGLSGFTLAANNAGGNTGNLDVAEVAIYGRALTDAEAQGAVDIWARRYGIDRVGRTSV